MDTQERIENLLARAEVRCVAEPETLDIAGHYDTDEPELDREMERGIEERINRGDTWAWCCVKVHASVAGLTAESDWLGCCSYETEADYRRCNDYFADQKAEALDRLRTQLATIAAELGF